MAKIAKIARKSMVKTDGETAIFFAIFAIFAMAKIGKNGDEPPKISVFQQLYIPH